jgi:hypothetical protein
MSTRNRFVSIQASKEVQFVQMDRPMNLANVAIEYRITVRYASYVPESELDELVHSINRHGVSDRLLDSVYSVLKRFPGLLVEIYEDHSDAPVNSVLTTSAFRRSGT